MPVRSTESRLPEGYSAADLGQAVVSSDNKLALVSYCSQPITMGRRQHYVAFVLDGTLQANVANYQWQVGTLDVQTQEGVWTHTPDDEGSMELTLTLLDSGGVELKSVTLQQDVVSPNQELENLIEVDDAVHPVAGDPETSREVINDFLIYYHDIAPLSSAEYLNRLLFAISYVESLDHPKSDRDQLLDDLAEAVNNNNVASFYQQAGAGAGVCRLRPPLLAMVFSPGGSALLSWEELPEEEAARTTALNNLQGDLEALSADNHIDIFNLLRFPKSNLSVCRQILEALRGRYFSGDDYETILSDATRSARLLNQFKTGPLAP